MPSVSASPFSIEGKSVWVAGHRGMVGAALVRRLAKENCRILTVDHQSLDLRRQADVEAWMQRFRPQVVYVAAGTVGGILANSTRPAEFAYDNLMIAANIIHSAHLTQVQKLVYLGSSCMYPRLAEQPVAEEALFAGPVEPTSQWYAEAKIAGMKLCQAYRRQYSRDFITVIPNNVFGPGDNFDPTQSHVLAALIAKFHAAKAEGAKAVSLWGTGTPKREFLFAEDLADGLMFLTQRYSEEGPINIGSGAEVSILELAEAIAKIVGFDGALEFDTSKPDGAPRKLLDTRKLSALGWRAHTTLPEGLRKVYAWYRQQALSKPAKAAGMA